MVTVIKGDMAIPIRTLILSLAMLTGFVQFQASEKFYSS